MLGFWIEEFLYFGYDILWFVFLIWDFISIGGKLCRLFIEEYGLCRLSGKF